MTPRLGPRVLERLEQAGFDSAEKMLNAGVEQIVKVICDLDGSPAWRNRRSALAAALRMLDCENLV